MMLPSLMTGPWRLSDLAAGKIGTPKSGMRVLSTFACGGGSTMGWKLAGFDVIGAVEIDKQMSALYRKNHAPKHLFEMPIQAFNEMTSFPDDISNIDVLDGSPPCTIFSTAGNQRASSSLARVKKFREGQATQRLDDLVFHFIRTAQILRPKVMIAENVKGLLMGRSRGYVKEVFQAMGDAGYEAQLFLLNASRMGVPQRRERTFFIARRRDLNIGKLTLQFSESEIAAGRAIDGCEASSPTGQTGKGLSEDYRKYWEICPPGKDLSAVHPKKHLFSHTKLNPNVPSSTISSSGIMHHVEPRNLNRGEVVRLQTFPDDYDFIDADPTYVCGMSVPPYMMQRIALKVAEALLKARDAYVGS